MIVAVLVIKICAFIHLTASVTTMITNKYFFDFVGFVGFVANPKVVRGVCTLIVMKVKLDGCRLID